MTARIPRIAILTLTASGLFAGCVNGDVNPKSEGNSSGDSGKDGTGGNVKGGSNPGGIAATGGSIGGAANIGASGNAGAPSSATIGVGIANGGAVAGSLSGNAGIQNTPTVGGSAVGGSDRVGTTGGTSVVATTSTGGFTTTNPSPGASGASSNGGTGVLASSDTTGGTSTGGVQATGGTTATGGSPQTGGTGGVVTDVAGNAGVAGVASGLLCNPSRSFCKGNDIHVCGADGQSSTKSAGCLSSQYCDSTTVTCIATVCRTFNQPSCDGNVATTCNDNGSGFKGARVDCSTTGQTCSHGACFSQMVDTVGDEIDLSPYSIANYGGEIVVFYEVKVTRYLHKAELYASLAKDTSTTCSVYESDVKAGTYLLKSPGVGGKSIGTTSASTFGWQPCSFSPPVELLAGRFYAIGLGTTESSSIQYLRSQLAKVQSTTFADAFMTNTYYRAKNLTASGVTSVIADQRLTTVP